MFVLTINSSVLGVCFCVAILESTIYSLSECVLLRCLAGLRSFALMMVPGLSAILGAFGTFLLSLRSNLVGPLATCLRSFLWRIFTSRLRRVRRGVDGRSLSRLAKGSGSKSSGDGVQLWQLLVISNARRPILVWNYLSFVLRRKRSSVLVIVTILLDGLFTMLLITVPLIAILMVTILLIAVLLVAVLLIAVLLVTVLLVAVVFDRELNLFLIAAILLARFSSFFGDRAGLDFRQLVPGLFRREVINNSRLADRIVCRFRLVTRSDKNLL